MDIFCRRNENRWSNPTSFFPPNAGLKTWLEGRDSQGEIKRLEKSYKNKGLARPAGEAKGMLVRGSILTFLF